MRRLLISFVAALAAFLGVMYSAGATAASITPAPIGSYGSVPNDQPTALATPERGPPGAVTNLSAGTAVDHQSHCTPARPRGPKTRVAYDCDAPAGLVQVDNRVGMTARVPSTVRRDLSSFQRWQVAAEDVPLASGKLFVNGSKSANNLTPRLTDTDGLSSFDTLEAGVKQGGKGQCFDVACLREGGLGAFKTGPPGHYSIRPLEPGGMDAWLASRAAGTEAESPFTQFLQSIAETVWNR